MLPLFFMTKRAAIFIDGENFRNSICGLFTSEHRKEDYLPATADWQKFLTLITENTAAHLDPLYSHFELTRCYWYVVGEFSSGYHHETQAFSVVPIDQKLDYFWEYASSVMGDIKPESPPHKKQEAVKRCQAHLKKQKGTLDHRTRFWSEIQSKIQSKTNKLEFRRFGKLKVDLDNLRFGSEKGTDVKLAVDMILLRDSYDVAILVSGDADYIPAVEALKAFGKHVVMVDFLARDGETLPGGARKLKEHCDATYSVGFQEMANSMGIKSTNSTQAKP